jgi:putative peptidoglycan lipid II flippase
MSSSSRVVLSAGLIAGLTLVSRLLGLVRESLFSYFFATGELLSAFRIAFQAPNLARRLFGEGALSSAMIPVLTDTLHERGEDASRRLVGNLLTLLLFVLTAAVVGIEIVLAVWRWIYDDPALRLTAILMPYMALICTAAVASGVLNVRRHFAVPAAAPTLLNAAMIVALVLGAALGLGDNALMNWVCASVLLAGVLQLAATAAALRHVAFFPILGTAWRDPQIRRVFVLMGPMALGLSAVQINTLVDSVIAYLFITENGVRVGPAVLGYAQFLYQLPLGVAGISLATAIFPELSARIARNDRDGFAAVFERGIRTTLFIALPSAVGLIFVAHPLVATLYQRGEFDAADTARVAATLVFYSVGIPSYFAQHIVVRAFYALQDSRTPARTAIAMVALDLVLNLALVFVMEERGLALATAVCGTVQVLWLLSLLRRMVPQAGWLRLLRGIWRTVAATTFMAAALAAASWLTPWLSSAPRLAILVTAGVVAYLLSAHLLGIEELRALHRPSDDSP